MRHQRVIDDLQTHNILQDSKLRVFDLRPAQTAATRDPHAKGYAVSRPEASARVQVWADARADTWGCAGADTPVDAPVHAPVDTPVRAAGPPGMRARAMASTLDW
ncbi:hypothetical protein GCM10010336_27640 [Streptomyces goshikiensis]|nr:hypothetical protein GCM10010336_27640 [Streptomyces goshikiensis]